MLQLSEREMQVVSSPRSSHHGEEVERYVKSQFTWLNLVLKIPQFILVLLALSIICNITPNTYSAALSAQTLLPIFEKIPRAIWCVVMFIAYSTS
jgi:purine-cytosine permease-like protein